MYSQIFLSEFKLRCRHSVNDGLKCIGPKNFCAHIFWMWNSRQKEKKGLIPTFFDISGCVLAHAYMNKALEKLVEFLEKKRQAGDENQNNGLVLLCKNQDCLGALLNLLSPDLSLNTIKGFGLLDSVCQLDEIQVSILYF